MMTLQVKLQKLFRKIPNRRRNSLIYFFVFIFFPYFLLRVGRHLKVIDGSFPRLIPRAHRDDYCETRNYHLDGSNKVIINDDRPTLPTRIAGQIEIEPRVRIGNGNRMKMRTVDRDGNRGNFETANQDGGRLKMQTANKEDESRRNFQMANRDGNQVQMANERGSELDDKQDAGDFQVANRNGNQVQMANELGSELDDKQDAGDFQVANRNGNQVQMTYERGSELDDKQDAGDFQVANRNGNQVQMANERGSELGDKQDAGDFQVANRNGNQVQMTYGSGLNVQTTEKGGNAKQMSKQDNIWANNDLGAVQENVGGGGGGGSIPRRSHVSIRQLIQVNNRKLKPIIRMYDSKRVLMRPKRKPNDELIIAIVSAPSNFNRRADIRESWRKDTVGAAVAIGVLFFVGKSKDIEVGNRMTAESKVNQDLVQMDFVDSYENLTLKSYSIVRWFVLYTLKARYLLKVDDDTFVNVDNLVDTLSNLKDGKAAMLMGVGNMRVKPIRDENATKHYVSENEYSGSTYPPYLSGGGYLMSRQAAVKINYVCRNVRFLSLEDVFVTGICANRAGIRRIHDKRFRAFLRPPRHDCVFANRVLVAEVNQRSMTDVRSSIQRTEVKNADCSKHY